MALALCAAPLWAETLRIATFDSDLTRKVPGQLLEDLQKGDDPGILAAIALIDRADADVLLLTDFDYDAGLVALTALNDRLARPFPHRFALRPNTGRRTGLDLDGDGTTSGAEDAQGFGLFAGQGGMAILSRREVLGAQDFATLLWGDMPDNHLANWSDDPAFAATLRLAGIAHWNVTLQGDLHLLAFAASPPLADSVHNIWKNRDEVAFFGHYLDGRIGGTTPPAGKFVILGKANLDPANGSGEHAAITTLLADRRVQDTRPVDAKGQTATAIWPDGPGALRVDYVLPSADLRVLSSAILRDEAALLTHGLVLVEIATE